MTAGAPHNGLGGGEIAGKCARFAFEVDGFAPVCWDGAMKHSTLTVVAAALIGLAVGWMLHQALADRYAVTMAGNPQGWMAYKLDKRTGETWFSVSGRAWRKLMEEP